MRTLKKTLCLVLALAMVLGLGVTSASAVTVASDYTDYNDVTYKSAVDVMTAIGVLDGMGDETFVPAGKLQRQQAAKIITYLLLGPTDAEKIRGVAAPFDDVPVGQWSSGFIAFCKSQNIIDGIGDNNFGPEDELTGLAFAKMLLGALGYDQDKEGLSGDYWAINTAKMAVNAGLDEGLDSVKFDEVLTREQAAQMALNALKATEVEYTNDTTIVAGGVIVSISNKASAVTTTKITGANISDELNGSAASTTNPYVVQFAEEHFPTLTLDTDARDEFGRPGEAWRLSGVKIGFEADKAVATYGSGEFTGKNAKALNDGKTAPTQSGFVGTDLATSQVWLRYNGQKWNLSDVLFKDAATAGSDSAVWHNDTTGVNGYEVEVYRHVHDKDDCYSGTTLNCTVKYDVIVIEPWVAVVTGVAANGTVSVALLDGGTAYNTPINTTTTFATIGKDDDLYSVVANSEEGDVFAAYWVRDEGGYGGGGGLVDLVPLEEKTVTISRIDGEGTAKQNYLSTVTADGTVYKFAKSAVCTDGTNFYNPGFKDSTPKIGLGEATLYCLNGKVMVVDQTPEVANKGFAYVLDYKKDNGSGNTNWTDDPNGSSDVYYVRLQLADNSIIEVVADKSAENKQGRMVYYEAANVNGVETYSLYNINANNVELAAAGYSGLSNNSVTNIKITPNVAVGEGTGGSIDLSDYVFDSKTLFFVATAGTGTKNDTVTVYQGIANVPALDGTAEIRVAYDSTTNHVAAIQVRYAAGGTDKDAYFIAGYTGAVETTETINDTEYTYYNFKAVVNGEIIDVKVSKTLTSGTAAQVNYVQSVTYTDGIITALGTAVNSVGATGADTITKKTNNTVAGTGDSGREYYINASTVIYQYDTNGNIKTIEFKDVAATQSGYIVTTTSTSQVVSMLFVEK